MHALENGELNVQDYDITSDWLEILHDDYQRRDEASVAGSPCNTYSEARHHRPEGVETTNWPRPIRSAEAPSGLRGLRARDMKHLQVGSSFALVHAFGASGCSNLTRTGVSLEACRHGVTYASCSDASPCIIGNRLDYLPWVSLDWSIR